MAEQRRLRQEAGVQRLIDVWRAASLAERNAFLWLAAEEIQAAADGELLNALITPQAQGNGQRGDADEAERHRLVRAHHAPEMARHRADERTPRPDRFAAGRRKSEDEGEHEG